MLDDARVKPISMKDDDSGELPLALGLLGGLLLLVWGLLFLSPADPAPRAPPGARADQALAEPHLGAWAETFRNWHSPPHRSGGGVLDLD